MVVIIIILLALSTLFFLKNFTSWFFFFYPSQFARYVHEYRLTYLFHPFTKYFIYFSSCNWMQLDFRTKLYVDYQQWIIFDNNVLVVKILYTYNIRFLYSYLV